MRLPVKRTVNPVEIMQGARNIASALNSAVTSAGAPPIAARATGPPVRTICRINVPPEMPLMNTTGDTSSRVNSASRYIRADGHASETRKPPISAIENVFASRPIPTIEVPRKPDQIPTGDGCTGNRESSPRRQPPAGQPHGYRSKRHERDEDRE